MAIPNRTALATRYAGATRIPFVFNSSGASPAARLASQWVQQGGATPTTAQAPLAPAGVGGMIPRNSSTQNRLLAITSAWTAVGGFMTLADRLSHQGGLSGTATTAQLTNLPTFALPRFTNGVGVMASADIYTTMGSTGSTASVTYTNDANVSGQVSPAFGFGIANSNAATRSVNIPLQLGDRGVRAVASVTLATSSGTTGNFGITLFYPLVTVPFAQGDRDVPHAKHSDALFGLGTWFAPIPNDVVLQVLFMAGVNFAGAVLGELVIGED